MLKYLLILFDFLMGSISWMLFYSYRKVYIEQTEIVYNRQFYLGIILIPLLWLLIYFLQGTYYKTKRIYRAKILNFTLFGTLFGTICIFLIFILDDVIDTYKEYYQSILGLFIIHFVCVAFTRYILVNIHVKKVKSGKIGFKTIIIGDGEQALEIYNELIQERVSSKKFLIGYVQVNGDEGMLSQYLPKLGLIDDIRILVDELDVEEVIIALDQKEENKLKKIVSEIYSQDVVIKVLPNMFDILSGSVKMSNIFGVLLIEIDKNTMPYWQIQLKRVLDIVSSLIAVVLLLPVYFILAIIVKFTSRGPVFFLQDRVGWRGKIFKIIKFRTMYVDAESAGPQLSSDHDPRITSTGKTFRKLRLDELPQFINVLKGDMSLVGPRPERQYFIDQIVAKDPQYLFLNSVRPGITSWGQIKFGYAETVDQMVQRMKYDLLYLRNRSLALDFKILIGTVMVVLRAKGK